MKRALCTAIALAAAAGCGDDGEKSAAPSVVEGPAGGGGGDPGAAGKGDETPSPPARREEHAVFHLGDNRLLAHPQRGGGLLIRAGSTGLLKYARFGMPKLRWKTGRERKGVRVGLPDRVSSLSFPLAAEQAKRADAITIRLHSTGQSRVTVKLNGRSPGGDRSNIVNLEKGWQTAKIPVMSDRLAEGANLLVLQFRDRASAVEWIQVGGDAPADAGLPDLYDPDEAAFVLPEGSGLAYYVQVPKDGHLVADVSGEACEVRVDARDHGGEAVTGVLRGARAGIGLEKLEGKVVRLDLTAAGCPEARLANAALTIPGPVPVVRKGAPPKHIIFWVMDTLRGDKVRVATPGARAEVPVFEKLAETGTSFRQHYVQGNESQTSHSSFWTSLYPVNHKVLVAGPNKNYQLSKRFPTFVTLLEKEGFHNVGVTANGTIHGWTGYTRGFDSFRNLMQDGTGRRLKWRLPAEMVYGIAFDKLGEKHKDPFLLFIGTIDNHKPWVAHEPWISKYDPEPYEGRYEEAATGANLGIPKGTMQCPRTPKPRDLERIFAIYDSDISYSDSVVGVMLEKLKELGIADETMLIITADHGEELWEYPHRCGHASSARESLVRVPLILHYPPHIPGGYVDEGVEGVDLLPTMLDALGLPPLEAAQGESLIPLTHGVGRGYPRPSYSSQHEYAHTMRLGIWKMWVGKNRGVPALYDMTKDRDERENLARVRHLERQFVSDAFSLFLLHRKKWKKRHWGVASNMTARAALDLESPGKPKK